MVKDVTNSPKDNYDFWYNSDPIHPPETNNNYNELVDYQVQSMNRFESISDTMKEEDLPDWTNNERPPFIPKTVSSTERKSFDELYNEYSSKSIPEQITNLKQLGRQLVSQIDKIIDKLDVVLEEDKKD